MYAYLRNFLMLPEHMGMRTTADVTRWIAYVMRAIAYVMREIANATRYTYICIRGTYSSSNMSWNISC